MPTREEMNQIDELSRDDCAARLFEVIMKMTNLREIAIEFLLPSTKGKRPRGTPSDYINDTTYVIHGLEAAMAKVKACDADARFHTPSIYSLQTGFALPEQLKPPRRPALDQ